MSREKLPRRDVQHEEGAGHLVIEIPPKKLGDFISGLLGHPRSTRKVFSDVFNIDHDFLCHLDHIIHQRITTQQAADLVAFSAKLSFDDNREHTVNSQESFHGLNDLSRASTNGISLTWTYLVTFPNRLLPEKQTIGLWIMADIEAKRRLETGPSAARIIRDSIFFLDESHQKIIVNVEYTELTLG